MMRSNCWLDLLCGKGHVGLVLISSRISLAVFDPVGRLLALLHQTAARAAANSGEIDKAAALEIESFADVGTLQGGRDPEETTAGRATVHEALHGLVRKDNATQVRETYRGVHWLVAPEVGIFMQPVVGLAKGDTGETPGHKAKVDRVEARKEAVEPA